LGSTNRTLGPVKIYYPSLDTGSMDNVYFWRWNGMGTIKIYRKIENKTEIDTYWMRGYSDEENLQLKQFITGCVPLRKCDNIFM
jgi:hypothetical protein